MNIPLVKLYTIRRKNRTSYGVDYMHNCKRIREIVAHNKKEAEIIKADRQQQLTLGIHGIHPHRSRIISLKELLSNYLSLKKGTVRETTYKRYENYFTVFERFMYEYLTDACSNISNINSRYLQECFNLLSTEEVTNSKSWHHNTINILRDLLAEIFNDAIKEKYITENPIESTRQLDAPKKDMLQFYSKEQLNNIIINLDSEWKSFIKFLTYTGLRKGELINLTWDNVSLNAKNPYIRITTTDSFRTKSGRTQTIRITNQALEILNSQQGKNPVFVFPSKRGAKLRNASPNEALNKSLEIFGIKGTIHMLRHTFASHFLMDGVGNLNDLMNYLSQANMETTKIYAHLSPEYQAEIVKKLEKSQQILSNK